MKSTPSRALVALGAALVAATGILGIEHLGLPRTARLIECAIAFAALATLAWTARGFLRNGLVVLASFVFGLAVLEGIALAMSKAETGQPVASTNDSGLSQYRPLLGWGPTRSGVFRSTKTAADGRVIYDTHVTIDETLNRRTEPSGGARPIVFFGDSWIYGDGVDDDGTLPQAFADLTKRKIPVLNLSFAGWSPAQNLLALKSGLYEPLLRAPRHFIIFASTFHLERTACKGAYAGSRSPRFVPDGSGVTFAGPCAGRFSILTPLQKIARGFALYRQLEPMLTQPTRHDVETYLDIVETFVATAKKMYDVPTTVLFVRFDDGYLKRTGYTDSQIVEALRKRGADVLVDKLPAIDDPSLYQIAGDGHPTKLANKARAKEIEAHLKAVDPGAFAIDTN